MLTDVTVATVAAALPWASVDNIAPPGWWALHGIATATLVTWVLWTAAVVLWLVFVVGAFRIGSISGSTRSHGFGPDIAVPVWPLVAAIVLGVAGTIFALV